MKRVSIITVNFNHSYVTDELLNSIRDKNSYTNIEIIVVDNGSKEDPVPQWKNKYPEAIFIRSATNLGFAGGNNVGIKYALGSGPDYVLVLNDDMIVSGDLLKKLVTFMDLKNEVGIVSPKIYFAKGYEFHKERYKNSY